MTGHVPEPERKEEIDENLSPDIGQFNPLSSEEEENSDDGDQDDNMNGYMPLPQVQNDAEMPHVAVHLPESDEEECDNSNDLKDDTQREIKVDENLVLSAMKGISLSGSCIPSWAKELSEPEWNNIVKRTIKGEKLLHSEKESE